MAKKSPIRNVGVSSNKPFFNEKELQKQRAIYQFTSPIFPKKGGGGGSARSLTSAKTNFELNLWQEYADEINKIVKAERDGLLTTAESDNIEEQLIKTFIDKFESSGKLIKDNPELSAWRDRKPDEFNKWFIGQKEDFLDTKLDIEFIPQSPDRVKKTLTDRYNELRELRKNFQEEDSNGRIIYNVPEVGEVDIDEKDIGVENRFLDQDASVEESRQTLNVYQRQLLKNLPVGIINENGQGRVAYAGKAGDINYETLRDDGHLLMKVDPSNDVMKNYLITYDPRKNKIIVSVDDENGAIITGELSNIEGNDIIKFKNREYKLGDTAPVITKEDTKAMEGIDDDEYQKIATKPNDGMWVENEKGEAFLYQGGIFKYSSTVDIANEYGYEPGKTKQMPQDIINQFLPTTDIQYKNKKGEEEITTERYYEKLKFPVDQQNADDLKEERIRSQANFRDVPTQPGVTQPAQEAGVVDKVSGLLGGVGEKLGEGVGAVADVAEEGKDKILERAPGLFNDLFRKFF